MKFNVNILKQILQDAEFFNLPDTKEFDYLNIAKIAPFEQLPQDNVLYFCVYELDAEREGWYDQNFDRTTGLDNLKKNPSLTLVIDTHASREGLQDIPHIFVPDIFKAIRTISDYVVTTCKPEVIGITGSVGKTTAAALIEDVVAQKFAQTTLRIYSKRLTPLTLSSWIVNFVNEETTYVVLEYSMYRSHHIKELVQILEPTISVFLNIRPVHLGVAGISTMYDIAMAKSALLTKHGTSVVCGDEAGWNNVLRRKDYFFGTQKAWDVCGTFIEDSMISISYGSIKFPVTAYVCTDLFLQQALAAFTVGKLLGISDEASKRAIEQFKPEENRILWTNLHGKRVLFDGEMSNIGRMRELSNHHYETSTLLIHSLNSVEQIEKQGNLEEVFKKFDNVFIVDNQDNLTFLKRVGFIPNQSQLIHASSIPAMIPDHDFIVYHYGGFYRKFSDPKELETMSHPKT